jgi:glutamate formiminotransferase/formiminotetrahydrofolate cyclodeaminase
MPALVECVPNFSEGRNQETLEALRAALASVPGVRLLDVQADADHNRSVFTFVAPPDAALEAAFRAVRTASERIDLRVHTGEHPRMGAADVVPFVPLEGVTMDDCIVLAKRLGERIGNELAIPVFLYARAATRPSRERLPDVRRGGFEGLREEIGTNAEKDPDFGPRHIHQTAGAVAVGARPFLVAYNVYLAGGDEALAKSIARKVRAAGGGLPAVQAMGITVGGEPQVSMNLLDIDTTPVHVAFDAVAAAAREAGADAGWSEIVGLVPERAVLRAAEAHLGLREPVREHVLEEQVRRSAGPSLGEWMDAVASATPTPGGGTVAAVAGAMGAALAAMVARLTVGRKKYAAVDAEFRALQERAETLRATLVRLGDEDAAAFDAVSRAFAIPKDREAERTAAIQAALLGASRVPLETLRAARDVAALAARAAEVGNRNAVSDAGVAALLAGAAARGAAYNVRINVAGMSDAAAAAPLVAEAQRLVEEARADADRAAALVEAAIGGGA